MIYGIYAIIILSIFLVGFSIGRRIGIKEGLKEGANIYAFKLREELLQKSYCPVCHKLH